MSLTLSLPCVSTSSQHQCVLQGTMSVDNNIYFFFSFSVLLHVFFGVSVLNQFFKYFM